jgi:hypothetical protein
VNLEQRRREKHVFAWLLKHKKQLVVWALVLTVVLLIMIGGSWLGRHYRIAPYLAGLGAGLAAFLAPIPGLVTPETRGKWLVTVLIAAIIGVGVWYSADDLEKSRDDMEKRLDTLTVSFKVAVKDLPKPAQEKIFENTAHYLRDVYNKKEQQSTLDLSDVLLTIDADNGYALYFAGLGSRGLGDRSSMRTYFRHYLATADQRSEAQTGAYEVCYSSPDGYCRERTDWINHLMANDYYQEAENVRPEAQGNTLAQALKYERSELAHRIGICGFEREGTVIASYDLLEALAARAAKSEPLDSGVRSLLGQYQMQCGLTRIQVSPANPTIIFPARIQLKVIGIYEPGSPGALDNDLTKSAQFRSSDLNVAEINSSGEVLPHEAGTAEIRAEVTFSEPGNQVLTDSTIVTVTLAGPPGNK